MHVLPRNALRHLVVVDLVLIQILRNVLLRLVAVDLVLILILHNVLLHLVVADLILILYLYNMEVVLQLNKLKRSPMNKLPVLFRVLFWVQM